MLVEPFFTEAMMRSKVRFLGPVWRQWCGCGLYADLGRDRGSLHRLLGGPNILFWSDTSFCKRALVAASAATFDCILLFCVASQHVFDRILLCCSLFCVFSQRIVHCILLFCFTSMIILRLYHATTFLQRRFAHFSFSAASSDFIRPTTKA